MSEGETVRASKDWPLESGAVGVAMDDDVSRCDDNRVPLIKLEIVETIKAGVAIVFTLHFSMCPQDVHCFH